MTENPQKKQDFLEAARRQFAQVSAEFERGLDALKDPERRKEMASSYLDLLQAGLAKAQENLAKYQQRVAAQPKGDRPAEPQPPQPAQPTGEAPPPPQPPRPTDEAPPPPAT
jgi:hypothetical protein